MEQGVNWLRRIIPWAFQHDMHVRHPIGRWDREGRVIYVRMRCKRCGFVSEECEIAGTVDYEAYVRSVHKRGCRGAQ